MAFYSCDSLKFIHNCGVCVEYVFSCDFKELDQWRLRLRWNSAHVLLCFKIVGFSAMTIFVYQMVD